MDTPAVSPSCRLLLLHRELHAQGVMLCGSPTHRSSYRQCSHVLAALDTYAGSIQHSLCTVNFTPVGTCSVYASLLSTVQEPIRAVVLHCVIDFWKFLPSFTVLALRCRGDMLWSLCSLEDHKLFDDYVHRYAAFNNHTLCIESDTPVRHLSVLKIGARSRL